MRGAGFATPRIAVAALNPHGGENGLFGREEIEIIAPAVAAAAAARRLRAKGRFPSDTVFLKAFGGEFDGVLTMYHDQGQIATKLKGFNRGVTVTGRSRRQYSRRPRTALRSTSSARASRPPARSSRRCAWARASLRAAETPHRVNGQLRTSNKHRSEP